MKKKSSKYKPNVIGNEDEYYDEEDEEPEVDQNEASEKIIESDDEQLETGRNSLKIELQPVSMAFNKAQPESPTSSRARASSINSR